MKEAVDSFKQVCKILPQDRDARDKYEITLKEYKYREMSKALSYDEKRVEINVADIVVEPSYSGPKLENISEVNAEWVVSMMDHLKDRKVLHRKYAIMII